MRKGDTTKHVGLLWTFGGKGLDDPDTLVNLQ